MPKVNGTWCENDVNLTDEIHFQLIFWHVSNARHERIVPGPDIRNIYNGRHEQSKYYFDL